MVKVNLRKTTIKCGKCFLKEDQKLLGNHNCVTPCYFCDRNFESISHYNQHDCDGLVDLELDTENIQPIFGLRSQHRVSGSYFLSLLIFSIIFNFGKK